MVLVSVIIPVYNAGKYIRECLDSVLNQTMSNLEVICINDGSTDDSLHILKNYYRTDSRVRVLEQENLGPGSARNSGMREAKGKYISFLDADDFWYDKCVLEKIVTTAEEKACNITGAFWGHYRDGKYERAALHWNNIEQEKTGRWVDFRDEQNCFNFGSYLFKKEFLFNNNIFFSQYYRFEDPPFLTEALVKACNYYIIPVDWYCYRTVYKSAFSTSGITVDFVKGVNDVLAIAEKHHLQKLSAEMIAEVNAACPYIINGIMQGNTELPVLLDKVNKYVVDKNVELEPLLFIRDSLQNQNRMIADAFWNSVKCAERLIIYGAGYYGNLLLKWVDKSNTDLEIVFAETECSKEKQVGGRKCLGIEELAESRENSFVVIAVLKETQPALLSNIKRLGFENYICLDMTLMTALECMGHEERWKKEK